MKNIIRRLFHAIIIGHELPKEINKNNIDNYLRETFICSCGYKMKIIKGIIFDYTLEKANA